MLERHSVGLLAAILLALAFGIAVLADRLIRDSAARSSAAVAPAQVR
jgi:hypothetical protein